MTVTTHVDIQTVIDNANMRLMCCAIGIYRFETPEDSTVIKPTIAIYDQDRQQIATILAPTLHLLMTHGVFMEWFDSVVTAVDAATQRGRLAGRLEIQAQARQLMGVIA